MILISYFVLALIEKYFFYKDKNIIFVSFIEAIVCIFLVNIIFTPIYLYILKTQDNLFITITIFAISSLISFVLGERLVKTTEKREIPAYLGFASLMAIFILTTYYPPHLPIFYDYAANKYGIN